MAMVDTVARDPLMPMPMPGTAVDTVDTDMEVMVDTDMVDTVEREKPKLNQKLKLKP